MATKWGFIGSGGISQDFVRAIKNSLKPDDHRLVAVAARQQESAERFAAKFQVEKAYRNYEEVAKDANVDVIYIGVLNSNHFTLAKMCLMNGKSVLCEKPMCMNVRETTELINLARSKKLFLMEGIWSRCFPLYRELQRRLQEKEIGDVVQVIGSFGLISEHLERIRKKELGGGGMGDMGVYLIQLLTLVMGQEKPQSIKAVGSKTDEGVDNNVSAVLMFSGNRIGTINCSTRAKLPNEAIVIGTKGSIRIARPFYSPIEMETPSGVFRAPRPASDPENNYFGSDGLAYEAEHVRDCLEKGLTESPLMTLDDSLLVAEILQEIRTQVGVVFH